jgi:hypothetical protein
MKVTYGRRKLSPASTQIDWRFKQAAGAPKMLGLEVREKKKPSGWDRGGS